MVPHPKPIASSAPETKTDLFYQEFDFSGRYNEYSWVKTYIHDTYLRELLFTKLRECFSDHADLSDDQLNSIVDATLAQYDACVGNGSVDLDRPSAAAESSARDLTGQLSGRPKWSDVSARGDRDAFQFIQDEFKAELISGTLSRAVLRNLDRPLYQAFSTQLSRSRKQARPIPELLFGLAGENPSDRVSRELQEHGIEKRSDAYRLAKSDPKLADRLFQAALVRKL
jgi:hypothetical protein